ncbi:UNVERIFIED_CONTAM: Cationic amino acid transporter 7, chloroplastic [Sesamum latifolium]|uniref:Cationic amino acid transporter 7, chloroplastic n=1 Tax=Sesamum latifolium TaxID=2727402 RepID=A0AAW2TA25_9LAMI
MGGHSPSFSSFKSYLRALSDTPNRLSRRACSISTSLEETSRARARSGSDMKRTLRWYDLVGLGVGGMVGAGVFVTTGHASRLCAGPAVVLSYAIAGVCALLSAFCYTEFAVDMPVAGGAFSYIRVTFGEFLAFLTGSNLIIDYVLSNAAVARGFTDYLGTALGLSTHTQLRFTIHGLPKGYNEIDLIAVAVVLLLTLVICYSTRESSWLNMVLTLLHILFIVFVIVVGFWRGDWNNFTEPGNPKNAGGFFPFGASGVFNGAAMVYLSYIGYDAVSTMAEEVKDPVKNIPIGVSGSVILVTVLYCLMAASMSALLPYDMIDPEAPFSGAFREGSSGWRWVSNVIVWGPVSGPPLHLHPCQRLRLPCNLPTLRDCWDDKPWPTLSFLFCSPHFCHFTLLWQFAPSGKPKGFMLGSCIAVAIGIVQLFHFMVPQARKPEFWGVPLMPWIPSISIFLNIFLLGALDRPSYVRFGFFSALVVLVYVLYSVHSSFDAEEDGTLSQKTGESMKESIESEDYTLKV